jgi:hypothetical protein
MDLHAPGALLNTEILALAHRQGATPIEVGVTHHPRTAGSQSGGSVRVVFRSLGEIVQLWRRLRERDVARVRQEPQALGAKAGE